MRYNTTDPKYQIEVRDSHAQLVNAATGVPIPSDEPVFIFRAKDLRALKAIDRYREDVSDGGNAAHANAVAVRCEDFARFRKRHPDRMKEPDTTTTGAPKAWSSADITAVWLILASVTGLGVLCAQGRLSFYLAASLALVLIAFFGTLATRISRKAR